MIEVLDMRWISAQDLQEWARSIPSEYELPKIVADLIRASAPDIETMRFPSGDKGRVRGFDGHLLARASAMNVPRGRSYWEFGTNEDYMAKAAGDFKKRTKEVDPNVQRDTTYVFVSPWTWDSSKSDNKLEDWRAARRTEGHRKDILYLDGVALQDWPDKNPAVAAWHAQFTLELKPTESVRSTNDFWNEFAGRCAPPFSEEVLLCERDELAKTTLSQLLGARQTLTIVADSPDEVVAFVVAVVRKAEAEVRLFLEARTVVVDSAAAGRQLLGHRDLILLLRGDAGQSPAQFAVAGTTVVALGRQQVGGGATQLPRPTGHAMGLAMKTMGLGETEAVTLARGCGRSLTALARVRPGDSRVDPDWLANGKALLPPILAGAWDATSDEDRKILERLAGGRSR